LPGSLKRPDARSSRIGPSAFECIAPESSGSSNFKYSTAMHKAPARVIFRSAVRQPLDLCAGFFAGFWDFDAGKHRVASIHGLCLNIAKQRAWGPAWQNKPTPKGKAIPAQRIILRHAPI
jgi:hypothetical protein